MTSRGYIDFNCDYWCAFCGHRVHKGQEKHDSLGRPTDWKCGHLLRYKVRSKNQGKDKTLPSNQRNYRENISPIAVSKSGTRVRLVLQPDLRGSVFKTRSEKDNLGK